MVKLKSSAYQMTIKEVKINLYVILLLSTFRFACTSLSFVTMVHYFCHMRAKIELVQKQELDHLSHCLTATLIEVDVTLGKTHAIHVAVF